MRALIALALLAFAVTAHAGRRDDYGYAWTLELEAGRAAHRLTLSEDVYARISDPELRDLEAFNAIGEAVPFGPVPQTHGAATAPDLESRVSLPWFALPRESEAVGGGLSVHIERDAQGRLRTIDSDVDLSEPAAAGTSDILIDATTSSGIIEEIELGWETVEGQNASGQFEVLGSNDFESWYTLVSHASLIDLKQGEFRLTRRTIVLPPNTARYLKLVRRDTATPFAFESVTALLWTAGQGGAASMSRQWSEARYRRSTPLPGAYEYQTIGPLPVERIAVRLASPNSVSMLTLQSRDHDASAWTTHGGFTAFRVQAGTSVLEHADLPIGQTRDRQWRVVAAPPLDRPPTLRVGYRPDQFAVLARAPAPYSLAAGSATAHRQDYPMAALLGALNSELGREWQLSGARLATPVTLRGHAALQAPLSPKPLQIWVLWGVLSIGVAAVVWMVLRLLKSPPPNR